VIRLLGDRDRIDVRLPTIRELDQTWHAAARMHRCWSFGAMVEIEMIDVAIGSAGRRRQE
jgi:hypothetical protein